MKKELTWRQLGEFISNISPKHFDDEVCMHVNKLISEDLDDVPMVEGLEPTEMNGTPVIKCDVANF